MITKNMYGIWSSVPWIDNRTNGCSGLFSVANFQILNSFSELAGWFKIKDNIFNFDIQGETCMVGPQFYLVD